MILQYIIKRIFHLIPVIFIISLILFGMLKIMPGDPVTSYIGTGANVTPEKREELETKLGLNKPIYIQYIKWVKRSLTGDFGESLLYKQPVKKIIKPFIRNSFIINIVVFFISFIIAIPIGIYAAVYQYSKFDKTWTLVSLLGVSMPSFFFGLILIYFFSVKLNLLPMNGMVTPGLDAEGFDYFIDVGKHMILPATVLVISSLAGLTRYIKNSMLEVIKQDYIRTARAKGLSEKVVIYRHAFKNALIPIVTLVGLYIPGLFSGAVILETLFLWPGIGNVLYEAVNARDYNLVMTLNMFFALLLLLGNLLADIGYFIVDPRVKVK